MIDWKKLASEYKQQYLDDLNELVSIDSSRNLDEATDEFPLGKGPANALNKFLSFGKRDGFKVKNIDNIVGYIEYGSGDQTFAILSHVDEMPGGKGWDTNPFELTEKDGVLYGRGVSDDKGPGLAAYYGLKMMKENQLEPNVKIRLILGTDEECDWKGMDRYFEVESMPDFGFSPDAEFPVINGEKGNITFETKIDANSNNKDNKIISFNSGLRENMVPREANVKLKFNDFTLLENKFNDFINNNPVDGDLSEKNGIIQVNIVGEAAHAMEPKNGINAGTYLAKFLSEFNWSASENDFIKLITNYLHLDSRGNNLGINYKDDIMGELTINTGLINYDENNGGFINNNLRYPKGITPKFIEEKISNEFDNFNGKVSEISGMVPHYVDVNDPIVETLIKVYQKQTDIKDAKPEVVGGGTYGRLMDRGVAFGALFPWSDDTMHQANEHQTINDLILAMSIYAEGIYELSK